MNGNESEIERRQAAFAAQSKGTRKAKIAGSEYFGAIVLVAVFFAVVVFVYALST